jgi:hypothetical protein
MTLRLNCRAVVRATGVFAACPEQRRYAAVEGEGASAHAGRYECDATKHTVRMENIMSLDPADEGKWDVMGFHVQRDTLEFSGPWTYKGEKLTFTIRLVRVKWRGIWPVSFVSESTKGACHKRSNYSTQRTPLMLNVRPTFFLSINNDIFHIL